MTADADEVRLRQLEAQFDFLRDKLLRTARALVVSEDRRSELLAKLAGGAESPPSGEGFAAARQAHDNADTATAIITRTERMARCSPLAVLPPSLDINQSPADAVSG